MNDLKQKKDEVAAGRFKSTMMASDVIRRARVIRCGISLLGHLPACFNVIYLSFVMFWWGKLISIAFVSTLCPRHYVVPS